MTKSFIEKAILGVWRREKNKSEEMKGFEIQCPFCSAAYTAEMLVELYDSEGCDSCGDESDTRASIEIKCSNCKRTVYVKEGSAYDF